VQPVPGPLDAFAEYLRKSTAARLTPGAICLSSSSHFALKSYSNAMNPVALPPGRARLSTMPAPTGSTAPENTIGGCAALKDYTSLGGQLTVFALGTTPSSAPPAAPKGSTRKERR
jgi:hypothetical protein